MIGFTRNFHPVGQGAFYSENIYIDGKRRFRMVYDCGSNSLSKSALDKRVMSDLGGDTNIDILFISHFDMDHVNGIRNLNPKTIIIPFLSSEQIHLLKLYNEIYTGTYDMELVENPADVFPEAHRIIRVLPAEDDNQYNEGNQEDLIIDIEDRDTYERQDSCLKSNSGILISNKQSPVWEYILYNPNWSNYAGAFKSEVENKGLDWGKLTEQYNAGYIRKHLSGIKEIYKTLKPKNLHSLVVYSNIIAGMRSLCYHFRCRCPIDCYCFHHDFIYSGCIYFGDATIEPKWRDSFYQCLNKDRLRRVGVLQVPHHGSYLSKGQNILSSKFLFIDNVICVISVGEYNRHGHPSSDVVQKLQDNGGIVVMVTEASSSLFYVKGEINL